MDARTPGVAVPAEFVGSPKRFFGLVARGSLLQIPTLGFYRFWLLTDVRRHLWSNTRIGGESLEYTGLARELLIGFLIALAILAPIYLIYFWIGLEAERLQAFGSIPLLLVLYILSQYASFRARRYRATRTIFRGLRFWMTGSGWAYAARAVLWDALTVITLGLALPWRSAALERYRMQHTHYGNLPGSFVGTGWDLFERGWWLWMIAVLAIPTAVAVPIIISGAVSGAVAVKPQAGLVATAVGTMILLFVFIYLIIWPFFRAIQLRWRLDGIRFGDVAFQSTLTKGPVFWCYLKAWLAGLAILILIVAAIGIVVSLTFPSFQAGTLAAAAGSPAIIAVTVGLYLLVLLGVSAIKLQFLDHGIWAAAANSLSVLNIETLDAVVARGAPAGSVGEGLADALDFGGVGV